MSSYKMDFSSCGIMPGFSKSSHICNPVALYVSSYIRTYHISLVIIISIVNTLRWHPFDWYSRFMSHSVIVITIDVSGKTKICYFDCKIFVYPNS